jgi:hypothetical protein
MFLRLAETDRRHRNNLLFYLIMAATCIKLQRAVKVRPSTIAGIDPEEMNSEIFDAALGLVRPIYEEFGMSDKAAKGPEFVAKLRDVLVAKYPVQTKGKPR